MSRSFNEAGAKTPRKTLATASADTGGIAHHQRIGAGQPGNQTPLQGWRRVVEQGTFLNFADLKQAFNSVDKVGDLFVFNIAGNNYRLIAAIHFNTQTLYVRSVMTHAGYDKRRA